jgi:hypothetical protein
MSILKLNPSFKTVEESAFRQSANSARVLSFNTITIAMVAEIMCMSSR